MNISYIQNIAVRYPALGRLIEAGIASALAYAVGALYEGKLVSIQGMIQAFITPLYMYLAKMNRDFKNLEN